MATTRLSDVIYGPLFIGATQQKIADLSTIRTSGIASVDDEIQRFANGPGDLVEMPFWNDISGDSNVSSDDPAQNATPNKLSQGKDSGRKIRRNNGWQAANLAASLIAEDPLDRVAGRIAAYWDREEQQVVVFILKGVFAAPSMAGNILPMASEGGTGAGTTPLVFMNAEVSANAHALLGDQGVALTAVLMHSRVFWNLQAQRAIEYGVDPVTGLKFATWHDKRVLVSDGCPRVPGAVSGFKYTTFFFGSGALGYAEADGEGGPKKPVEIQSAASAGNGEGVETVWHRRHFVMHPRGVQFTSAAVAGASPSNADLANGANWNRVYDPKLVRLVAVTTNG